MQLTGTDNLSLAEVQVFTGTPQPDLTVTKTHPSSFTQGQSGVYTITVTNSGSAATSATVTMTDSLPSGLTATGLSGSGWSCNVNTLTCSRGDALNAGSSYAPITLNVNVSNSATVGTVTNTATVSGGGETNSANDNGYDVTTINSSAGTAATMASPTSGSVLSGSTPFTWNASASATAYELWVGTTSGGSEIFLGSEGLNTSQTVSGIPGNGIPIYVRLRTNFSNGSWGWNDYQYVAPNGPPDLTITKSHPASFTQGQSNASYTITVSNSGAGLTNGTVTVSDTVPAGLTATAISGSGWTCTGAAGPCSRSDALAAGSSYPPIMLTVSVSPTAPAIVTNTATVSGGGESNTGNNTASDQTTINSNSGGTDLAIGKPAFQSSTICCQALSPDAYLAVDGQTDGNFYDQSVTHTGSDPYAWWQVDLQSSKTIGSVVVWNRTDCCSERLSDYYVFISDTPFQPYDAPGPLVNRAGTWSSHQTTTPLPSTTIVTGNVAGRYVRVQLAGQNNLSLAEVQVFGATSGPTVAAPTSSLAPGNYSSTQMVTLTSATSGASIRYTTDGSTPTSTVGAPYSFPIPVSSSMTIKAIAYQAGWADSSVSSWTYNITITGDFTIQASPSSQTVAPGQTGRYTLSVIPINGFNGTVNILVDPSSTAAQCANTTAMYIPAYVSAGTPVDVTITPGTSCSPSYPYYLYLRATAGSTTRSITLEIDTPQSSDFVLTAQSSTQTLGSAGSAYYQFQLSQIGSFAGQVNFSVSGLPAGSSWSFTTPQPVPIDAFHPTNSAILRVTSGSSIPTFTVTANAGSVSHSAPLSLVVQQGAPSPATMIAPTAGYTLLGNQTQTFSWNAGVGVTEYQVDVGYPGAPPLSSQSAGTSLQADVPLPNGTTPTAISVTLRSKSPGQTQIQPYTYQLRYKPMNVRPPDDDPTFPSPGYVVVPNNGVATTVDFWLLDSRKNAQNIDPNSCSISPGDALTWQFNRPASPGTHFTMTITATPQAGHDGRSVSCNYPGAGTMQCDCSLAVADALPRITDVEPAAGAPLTPPAKVAPGGRITVSGYNFGQSGNLKLCTTSGANCSTIPTLFWSSNGTQITAIVNQPPGSYGVIVEPNGYFNQSNYLPYSGSPAPDSSVWEVDVAAGPTLVVTSGGNVLHQGDFVNIDPTPALPTFTITVANSQPGDIVTYTPQINFTQTMPDCSVQTTAGGFGIGPQPSHPANEVVSFSPSPFGNQGVIHWQYNNVQQPDFTFNVLGQPPDTGAAEMALNAVTINGTQVWFAKNVAIHETAESQFWKQGIVDSTVWCKTTHEVRLGVFVGGPNSPAANNNTPAQTGMPLYGFPGGYGMMQLDPPVTAAGIWDWRQNIFDWQTKFAAAAGPERDTRQDGPLYATDGKAYPFWIRQVLQWQEYNARVPQAEVTWPGDPGPNYSSIPVQGVLLWPPPSSRSCSFLPPSKTDFPMRDTGQANTHWYGDAILMKQVGGAPKNYVSWVEDANPH